MSETALISRQEAIDELIAMREHIESRMSVIGCMAYEMAIEALREPERKKGKWEVRNILDYAQRPSGRKTLRCPFCGYLTGEFMSRIDYYHKLTNFCPNCGADMRGD